MTASPLFSFRNKSFEDAAPVFPGDTQLTSNSYKNWLSGVVAGAAPSGPTNKPSIIAAYDQAQAAGTLTDNGLVATDVAGAAINGVDATATYATSINNTLTLIKNKINAGGDTPNALIIKAVSAVRSFTDASGTLTFSGVAPGAAAVVVGGTTISFTATGVDATDAAVCAAAINADATAGAKVFASASGAVVTVTAKATNRATITGITGLTAGAPYGAVINGVRVACAVGTITISGSVSTEACTIVINDTNINFVAGASDTLSAVACAAAVNASSVGSIVYATNIAGVVYLICKSASTFVYDSTGANSVGLTTSVLVGTGVTADQTVITGASGTAATDSLALTILINQTPSLMSLVRAVNASSSSVTVIALESGDQMPAIGAFGTGLTVGGTTTPSTTITVSSASGTLTPYVNGVPVGSVTATGVNATDAAAIAALISASFFARNFCTATSSAGVVTVTSVSGISISTSGGPSVSVSVLTGSETWGGVAGNAVTLTDGSTSGITASGSGTLANGASRLTITATTPGVCGNWITFAAAGDDAAHVTASGSGRLTGGDETVTIVEV